MMEEIQYTLNLWENTNNSFPVHLKKKGSTPINLRKLEIKQQKIMKEKGLKDKPC